MKRVVTVPFTEHLDDLVKSRFSGVAAEALAFGVARRVED